MQLQFFIFRPIIHPPSYSDICTFLYLIALNPSESKTQIKNILFIHDLQKKLKSVDQCYQNFENTIENIISNARAVFLTQIEWLILHVDIQQ